MNFDPATQTRDGSFAHVHMYPGSRVREMAVSFQLQLRSIALNILLVLTCARGHLIVCDPSNYSEPGEPIPTLPTQFSTTIEANIVGRSSEIVVREYFDEIGNRGRLELSTNGSYGYAVFDYDLKEIFLLPDFHTGEECVVREIAQSQRGPILNFFGFSVRNGSVHIGTVSDLFLLTNSSPIKYIGNESVRGVPCNHWQSCFAPNTSSSSYTIDYYFSRTDTNWTSAYGDDPVPVQITLNGINEEGNESAPTFRKVSNIYSFVAFNAGPDSVPDNMFRLPTGIRCKGRIPGQKLPLLPNHFSAYFESVDEDKQTVRVARVNH